MIDFYKHSILSVLGKEAGSMTEIEYPAKAVERFYASLEPLKKMKKKVEEEGDSGYTELYL